MLKKISGAVATLALSASAAFASGVDTGAVNLTANDFITQTFATAAGSYSEAFSWTGLSLSGASATAQTVTWALYDSSYDIVDSSAVTYGTSTKSGGSANYPALSLAAGTYTIAFGTDAKLSATGARYTLTATSVPGPVSGAGLPALALAAGLILIWRRKAENEQ